MTSKLCVFLVVGGGLVLLLRSSLCFVASGQPAAPLLDANVQVSSVPTASGVTPLRNIAAPALPSASTGVFVAGAVLALLAVAVHRNGSPMTMLAKHDRRNFRGKLHGHTFGKCRLRKGKARRLKAIKKGLFDPEKVEQRGQPEPEHHWDLQNFLQNKQYYFPEYVREVWQDALDVCWASERLKWEKKMGIYGDQGPYRNWTPPGVDPSSIQDRIAAVEATSIFIGTEGRTPELKPVIARRALQPSTTETPPTSEEPPVEEPPAEEAPAN